MKGRMPGWVHDVMRPTKGELRRATWPVDPTLMDRVAAACRASKYERRSLMTRLRTMDVELPHGQPQVQGQGVRRSPGHPRRAAIKNPVPIRVDGEHEASVFARPSIAGGGLLAVAAAAGVALFAQMDPVADLAPGETEYLTAHDVTKLNSAITLIGPGEVTLTSLDEDGATIALHEGLVQAWVNPAREGRMLTVMAGDVEVSVQGTRFDVTRTGEAVGVEVYQGLVEVEDAHGSLMLGAGESWKNNPLHEGCKEDPAAHRPQSAKGWGQAKGEEVGLRSAPSVDALGQAGARDGVVLPHPGDEVQARSGRLPNAGEAGAWEAPGVEAGHDELEPWIAPELRSELEGAVDGEVVIDGELSGAGAEQAQSPEGAMASPSEAPALPEGDAVGTEGYPTCPVGEPAGALLDIDLPGESALGLLGPSSAGPGDRVDALGPERSHLPPPLTTQVPASRVSGPGHGAHTSCACTLDHS